MPKLPGVLVVPLCLLTAGMAMAQSQPAQDNPAVLRQTVDELRRQLDDERAVNARQAMQLEALARELAALRARVDGQAPQPAPPAPPAPTAQARLENLERAIQRLPELPKKVVVAGDFPGSIEVPGTEAAFKIGGEVRATAVHTLAPLGTDDRFIASSIPVPDVSAGDDARTAYTAAPTRLNFDLRSPSPIGLFRTFVEGDFAGSGSAFRLRHGYIQLERWLFGQTWSTFSDPEVQPIDIDFEGENALSRFRQAQLRYTIPLARQLDLALSAENPSPELTGAQGVNLTPDVVARVRWEPVDPKQRFIAQRAHLQAAVLFRSLRGEIAGQRETTLTTAGIGGTVSGVLIPRWDADDRIKFAAYAGTGIGRYITDLAAAGGQDAFYDPALNSLRALPATAAYAAYERRWRPAFLSAVTYGIVTVDNLDAQPSTALHRTQRATANVTWNPVTRADLVFEFLTGERVNKDGERGVSSQIQAGWRVRF